MPKPLNILDRSFASQKEAEAFFYGLRDENLASGGEDIAEGIDFDLLRELYIKYCEYTDWPLPSVPVAFYARDIARGAGSSGGTSQGFVVKFESGAEDEFSARKAIRAMANR
ncbi:TPA: hypothetical protein ACRNML_001289 [Pseudomonas aeruginosa]